MGRLLTNKTALDVATPYAEQLSSMSDAHIFWGSVAMLLASYVFGLGMVSATSPSSPNKQETGAKARRQSWIITFFSSAVMSVTGLYFAARMYATKGDILVPDLSAVGEVSDSCGTCNGRRGCQSSGGEVAPPERLEVLDKEPL
jgi:hypothetical protein